MKTINLMPFKISFPKITIWQMFNRKQVD